MAYALLAAFPPQFEDANGNPAAGHTLEFYIYNTSTPVALYTDAAGTSLGTSCTLNSLGRPRTSGGTPCQLFCDTAQTAGYKIVQKDADGATVQTFTGPIFPPVTAANGTGNVGGIVSTVSALRAVDKNGYSSIFVEGYYAKGDGGGGRYWYDSSDTTSADNGGSIIVAADGGRWKLTGMRFCVEQFGAVGNNTTDDTAAIQSIANAYLEFDFTQGKTYKISGTITLRNRHCLRGNGAQVRQSASQTPIFDVRNLTGYEITGLWHVGYRTDYVDSSSSLAIAYRGSGSSNGNIHHNVFQYFAYSPFYGEGLTNFKFADNIVEGPGLIAAGGCLNPAATPTVTRNNTGVTAGGTGITINGNAIYETGQGLIVAQGSSSVEVVANVIRDVRVEHGMYCDTGLIGLTIAGNVVRNAYQNGIKVQHYDAYGVTPRSIAITGNVIDTTTTGDGIIVNNSSGSIQAQGVAITGNTIRSVAQDGISARYMKAGSVVGNNIYAAGRAGIYVASNTASSIKSNTIRDTQENGVFDGGGNSGVTVSDNDIYSSGLSGNDVNGASSAILLNGGDYWTVARNNVKGDNTKTQYALFVSNGALQGTSIFRDNVLQDAEEYAVRMDGTQKCAYWGGNILSGLLGDSLSGIPEADQLGNFSHREFYSTAVPTTGTWKAGDVVWNRYPASAGYVGWVCTAAGSPGTWKTFGLVS